MGQAVSAPVTSVVVRRFGGPAFLAAVAEMNGWRPSMEDTHIAHIRESWAFFGVFDGHGGDQCAQFIARRLLEELATGYPADDAAVRELVLRLDTEFLATEQTSGCTGTFVIAEAPSEAGGKYRVRVGNIGDSRVLWGRPDGTMVRGPGSDGALTLDHKPDHPVERTRIERAGSAVELCGGVPRVNGDLALSRAFGDARFKKSSSMPQEQQAVSANPDLSTVECEAGDLLVLVCDGISEGDFPNREVIRLVAKRLSFGDPGKAAVAVCRQALNSGSKDNLSCMVVVLAGGEVSGPGVQLLPGPFEAQEDDLFVHAYTAMAAHAGLTLAEALSLRYDMVEKQLDEVEFEGDSDKDSCANEDVSLHALNAELAAFGDGPPSQLARGSAERARWFEAWLKQCRKLDSSVDTTTEGLINAELEDLCRVHVASLEDVRAAVEAHPKLVWDDNFEDACGQEGFLMTEDVLDGTSQVRFSSDFIAWLPTCVLTESKV
mmetsp:Transcript_149068/g.415455  ORF Transcript_149068/g.415455 Transcript_149068/m.415455 type:complete len:490 (+) Transcript_149068:72-1541(+)